MKHPEPLTPELIAQFRNDYHNDNMAPVLSSACARTAINDLVLVETNMNMHFNVEVKTRGITAQLKAGRCWNYSTMNIIREKIAEKCHLDMFTLSGNYTAFWDKLEKCNTYLETMIELADRNDDDRTLYHRLSGINDGGYWQFAVNMIRKYGVVPQEIMPENYQSSHTDQIVKVLNRKLRKDGRELREMVRNGQDPEKRKEEMLSEIYRALCIAFGEPPVSFDFEYTDKDGVYHIDRNLTGKSFYEKYAGIDWSDYCYILNHPAHDKEFHKTYTVDYITNTCEDKLHFLNLPMERMKEMIIAQLQDGEPVWFGNDSRAYVQRQAGIWDPAAMNYGGLFEMDMDMTKREELETHEAAYVHCMVFCGVNLEEGKPNRWKIENSWGEEAGRKGYFCASDAWVDHYVYQAVIHKKYLTAQELKEYEAEPIVLPPWDEVAYQG